MRIEELEALGSRLTQVLRDKGTLRTHLRNVLGKKSHLPVEDVFSGFATMGCTPQEIGQAAQDMAQEAVDIVADLKAGLSEAEVISRAQARRREP